MKVLLCTMTMPDHGEDTIFDGLCRVLGPSNVMEYPHKPSLHGERPSRNHRYPCQFDWPIVARDTDKEWMLADGKYDAVIVGCGTEYDFRDGSIKLDRFYELLKSRPHRVPIYLLDMGDLVGINHRLWDELGARLCFKREYRSRHERLQGVVPLNYSYSEKYIPDDIDTDRTISAFFAGSLNSYRKACLGVFREFSGTVVKRLSMRQENYGEELLKCKIGLSLRGFGHDTVRYYEVPAHGALLLAQRPRIMIDHPFVDGETALLFRTPDGLRSKLQYAFDNSDEANRIRLAGYEWVKKYHTSRVRATQLLERIDHG